MLNEVKKYLAFLQFEKKLSRNTVESYWLDLKHYTEHLINESKIKSFKKITTLAIRDYISIISSGIVIIISIIERLGSVSSIIKSIIIPIFNLIA